MSLGIAPDSPVRVGGPDERPALLDLLADVAVQPPRLLRGTTVVVGPADQATAVARRLVAETGASYECLLEAAADGESASPSRVVVAAAERCARFGAAVVVVLPADTTREQAHAAGRLAAMLGSGALVAAVDATREAEVTRGWLGALAEGGRRVDELAAYDVSETPVPLRLLELGRVVSWLAARPATLGAWAAPCLDLI